MRAAAQYFQRMQLGQLISHEEIEQGESLVTTDAISYELFETRLGRAGLLTASEQHKYVARWVLATVVALVAVSLLAFYAGVAPMLLLPVGFVTLYFSLLLYLLVIRRKAQQYERELLFSLPLLVENLLLLVKAGLGPIPAIAEILDDTQSGPVRPYLQAVYERASGGVLFEEALIEIAEAVPHSSLKHFFLHLEACVSQGAELSSSLQQLGEYIHVEWTVTVEGIVRRLESAVVFPVFLAVIGLLLLVSAVPLIPLLELGETIKSNQSIDHSQPAVRAMWKK